jgi:hypothetical protein
MDYWFNKINFCNEYKGYDMNTNKLVFICFNLLVNLLLHSIDWTQIYHDGAGKPVYTGGFTSSSPTFADIDGDQDYDCFIGNQANVYTSIGHEAATISYFKNTGTPEEPIWSFITNKYNDIDFSYFSNINVTFADIDADGDLDMFVGGNISGTSKGIHFYENIGDSQIPAWNFISDKFQDITTSSGTWNFVKTAFADLDDDGDLDLLFGNLDKDVFYQNTGSSTNPIFEFSGSEILIDNASGVCFRPTLIDIDADGDYDCFGGGAGVSLLYWINNGSQSQASWDFITNSYIEPNFPPIYNNTPEFCDIDNDADCDLFVGLENGKIHQYENTGTLEEAAWELVEINPVTIDVGFYSSPALCDIDGDNIAEMFIVGKDQYSNVVYNNANIFYYKNVSTPDNPAWELQSLNYPSINYNAWFEEENTNSICFADIDSDGDNDLFTGLRFEPVIMFFENIGDAYNPQYDSLGIELFWWDSDGDINYCPSIVDIDADGDFDMFISHQNGITGSSMDIVFFRNIGNPFESNWSYEGQIASGLGKIDFIDEDNDGDSDMFLSDSFFYHNIIFYRNTGDIYNFDFEYEMSNYANIEVGDYSTICFFDIDNDTDKDMIIGERDGGINLFRNDGGVSFDNHELQITNLQLSNYPNPFNPSTKIQFSGESFAQNEQITLEIYNIKGQKIRQFNIHNSKLKINEVVWDGRDEFQKPVSSGVYLYQIKSKAGILGSKKMILMK